MFLRLPYNIGDKVYVYFNEKLYEASILAFVYDQDGLSYMVNVKSLAYSWQVKEVYSSKEEALKYAE